jgi:adenylylsulfate kinase
MPSVTRGATVWFTGLPGAGKSTIARAVAALLSDEVDVEILDGDELRATLSSDLGFSPADRDTHVRRVGFVAELLARHGTLVLVPVIAPYATAREEVRRHHRDRGSTYVQVYVSTPMAECARRDPKGLYGKASRGELTGLTGVDDRYDVPTDPDLRVDTTGIDVGAAALRVCHVLSELGLLESVAVRPLQ